ncbi:GGDEF domain-containing protein [Butyrivibrio sp. AD3002]|uniref:GGDEF domain-containing protein n=1 Tax=Butyrivibrio sp. AD3002 TaxID=1280670 RepID=UPI0003B7823E|nr:GGDEF domain-containing protein [Butyrivibrio sp. AD3002]
MSRKSLESYTEKEVLELLHENVDAVILVDATTNRYRAMTRRNMFKEFIEETGDYHDLIEKLWFHIEGSSELITDEYKAFVSYYADFKGKFSRRLKVFLEGSSTPRFVQMQVYPTRNEKQYIFVMDELDDDEYVEEFMTTKKVNTIQNTYLFSMYVDLVQDTTSSLSVTEISDETVNSSIKYSEWRLMTVNMIAPEDKDQFLKITDPEYLKANLAPGRTISLDCMMMNLEGTYIWVKLIFSRTATANEDDFRFVFMVQDIHENFEDIMSTLRQYEELAIADSLTGLLNHGGIKTEILNAIDAHKKEGTSVSLMMIDIDFFKQVNDNHGHSTGDRTLKKFAHIIEETVVDKDAHIGRWGGEEFVIVYRGKTGDELYEVSETLRKNVEAATFPKIGQLTCSVGVTELRDEDSFDDVFNRVDKALYMSKESGRNKVTLK